MKPSSPPSKIELCQLTHLYVSRQSTFLAVQEIDLRVEEGEFICLVGPSGCGKTTLLSLIAGLEKPTAGSVYIDGTVVNGPNRRIGYMLQQDYLFTWLTIEENVMLGLKIQGRMVPESVEYTLQLLDEMELGGFRQAYPAQLSGGMRQRVALVRTLACRPDILLLDEPFSALDHQTKLKLEDLVVTTLHRQQKTAILVTHDLSEAVAMGDRIFILAKNPGRIHQEFVMPEQFRGLLPFETRNHPQFSALFHQVWREMEAVNHATI
ncbi:MAG: ABC transporter ATP-binding protein [Clostridia bacterium]